MLPQSSEQPGRLSSPAWPGRFGYIQGLIYLSGQKSVIGSFFSVIGMLSEFDGGSCSAGCILVSSKKLVLGRVTW